MNFPLDEQALLQRAQRGDNAAFEELIELHSLALFKVLRRITQDSPEAETLVQEAFLRAWQALRRQRFEAAEEGRPFFAYLVTIALNLRRDAWRKEKRLDFVDLDEAALTIPDAQSGPEAQLEEAQMLEALAQAVANLPLAYRMVIALRYDGGLSYQEAADTLDLPVNTVRTHLHRAKAHLRQLLAVWMPEGIGEGDIIDET